MRTRVWWGTRSAQIIGLAAAQFLVPAALPGEPVWVSGQAARLFIGQPYPTRQQPVSSAETIGGVSGIAVAGDALFVADSNRIGSTPVNNRILIYRNLSSFIPRPDDELDQGSICPACVGAPDLVLGQPDLETFDPRISDGLQGATAVHSDGRVVAVADTNNNRILLWLNFPTQNGQPPDVVVGQPDFDSNLADTTQDTLRGPQGVWVDGNRLFVADTQNSRILIWNSIPTTNGQSADIVLGQPDFDTRPEPDLTQSNVEPSASGMLDPVSVSVNNGRLFVSDLGFNRVLIFLTVPTSNAAPADVVLGQPDFESNDPNNSDELCEALPEEEPPDDGGDDGDSTGGGTDDTDEDTGPTFPRRCDRTLSFPRFALSDGQRLFIADGGNDRILIFNEIPQENGAAADVVLGQNNFGDIVENDGTGNVRAPLSLAHDGENLYVSDPFARRILVFTPGEDQITEGGLRNGASFAVRSQGTFSFEGDPLADQEITLAVGDEDYVYSAQEGDTAEVVRDFFFDQIASNPETEVIPAKFEGEGTHAVGRVTFSGGVDFDAVATLTINGVVYEAKLQGGDELTRLVDRFNFVIEQNPNPYAISTRDPFVDALRLIAREPGPPGNEISYSISVTPGAGYSGVTAGPRLERGTSPAGIRLIAVQDGRGGNSIDISSMKDTGGGINISTSGARLNGGGDAQELPAGSLASIFGENLADAELIGDFDQNGMLPTELGGLQVYCNGIRAPIFSASPTQINFQVPWEIESSSVSVYVRRRHAGGSVTVSVPRGSPATRAAPGLFAFPGPEPRRGVVVHGAGPATGTVAITVSTTVTGAGSTQDPVPAGLELTIIINGRRYTYLTVGDESEDDIRNRLIDVINAGGGDPEVVAFPGREGFFSARARVTFGGDLQPGDTVSIFVADRVYSIDVLESDLTLAFVRNRMVQEINSGLGDPDVTARSLADVGAVQLEVVARELGTSGNSIPFSVGTSPDALITLESGVEEEGVLQGGQTPPVVSLSARDAGTQGNDISYTVESTDDTAVRLTARDNFLCCGNEAFSLVTDENPAVPGEVIVVFGTGLGLTSPLYNDAGLVTGAPSPTSQLLEVPFVADDFVSSLAAGKTAQLRFAGLMPGFVGVYQINLKLNEDLPDDPTAPLTIAQGLFVSNVITLPVKNIRPRLNLVASIPAPDEPDEGEGDGGGEGDGN